MMSIFAQDVVEVMKSPSNIFGTRPPRHGRTDVDPNSRDEEEGDVIVDVGVTKCPFFLDKALAIEESGFYTPKEPKSPNSGFQQPEQIHITGFDTLTRLLNPKYYPPTQTLAPLSHLFSKHRIRVTKRVEKDKDWGDVEAQETYLRDLAEGKREKEGGKREWAERIELVDGAEEGDGVSSTKVRERGEGWRQLVTEGVREWIEEEGLYRG